MTPLPSLPPNLDPTCINCGAVSALTSQLNINSFAQTAIGQVQGVIGSQTAQLQALVAQANAANAATRALIETAIPDDLIDEIIQKYTPVGGIANIKCVVDELNKTADTLNKTYEKIINTSELPPVEVSGLLEELIPPIPIPDVPSPGEIKEYLFEVIEKKKKAQQEALIRAQSIAAGEQENV
jgi:hypothetical protein